MSEDTSDAESTPQNGPDPRNQQPSGETLSPDALRAELTRARGEAARYRNAAKENKDAADRLAEMEQAKKTETEKLTERAQNAENANIDARTELSRLRAALNAGVPVDQVDEFASRLRGDTDEELAIDAKRLRDFFAPAPLQKPERRPDPSQGNGGNGSGSESPSDSLAAFLQNQLNAR